MNNQELIFAHVQKDIHTVEDFMLAQIQNQQPDLSSAIEIIVKSGGKRIRPTLTLLVGEMLNAPHDKLLLLAAAIEMLHTATLVHDDLIDGSLLRRGMPTLNSRWSPGATVLTGDFLFARAAKMAAETDSLPVMKVFSDTLSTIINGEIDQMFGQRFSIDRKDYYKRIYAKTASLFENSAWCAALITSAQEQIIQSIRHFGYNLGMAFQIIDDILDFVGVQDTIGKPIGSDFRQGLITLPAIYYIEENASKPEMEDLLNANIPRSETIEKIVKDIINSGAIDKAFNEARDFIFKAKLSLKEQSEYHGTLILENLADFIIERRF